MTNEELKCLQRVQYEMLCDIADLFDKYNIKYYLAYGTLLGAVRHQGSIPWDNDVDIMIKREDCQKMMEILNNNLPKYLFWGYVGAGNLDYCDELRIYKKNTRQYTIDHDDKSVIGNISIDIFILDYEKKHLRCFNKFLYLITKFCSIAKLNNFEKDWLYDIHKDNKVKILIIKLGDFFNKFISEENFEKFIAKLSTSPKVSDHLTRIQENWIKFDKELFEEQVQLKYFDRTFSAPNGYKKILELIYGDYMEFPPENERFTKDLKKWIVEFESNEEQ